MEIKGKIYDDQIIEKMPENEFRKIFEGFDAKELIDFIVKIRNEKGLYRKDKILNKIINDSNSMFTFWAVDQVEKECAYEDDKYDYLLNLWEGRCEKDYEVKKKVALKKDALKNNYLNCFVHEIEKKLSRDSITKMYNDHADDPSKMVTQGPDYNKDYPNSNRTVHVISTRYIIDDPDTNKPIQVELGLVLDGTLEDLMRKREEFESSQEKDVAMYIANIERIAADAKKHLEILLENHPELSAYNTYVDKIEKVLDCTNSKDLIELTSKKREISGISTDIRNLREEIAKRDKLLIRIEEWEKQVIVKIQELLKYSPQKDKAGPPGLIQELYLSAEKQIANFYREQRNELNSNDIQGGVDLFEKKNDVIVKEFLKTQDISKDDITAKISEMFYEKLCVV